MCWNGQYILLFIWRLTLTLTKPCYNMLCYDNQSLTGTRLLRLIPILLYFGFIFHLCGPHLTSCHSRLNILSHLRLIIFHNSINVSVKCHWCSIYYCFVQKMINCHILCYSLAVSQRDVAFFLTPLMVAQLDVCGVDVYA